MRHADDIISITDYIMDACAAILRARNEGIRPAPHLMQSPNSKVFRFKLPW